MEKTIQENIDDFIEFVRIGEMSVSDLEFYLKKYVKQEEYLLAEAVKRALEIIKK